uniref:Polyprotein protein n=1 Tax=Solanum tuberosum TaxID=4113 RepID=M1DIL9_SOLTU
MRSTRLERSVPEMINSAILTALTPIRTTVDDLNARVTACENRQGETPEISALKAEITELKMDVAYLKATDFTALMRGADDKDTPNFSGTPPATMGDMQRDNAGYAESEMENDEEQIAVYDEVVRENQEDIIFRDLLNLEDMVVQSATQSVPVETSTPAPSRSGTASMFEATPSESGTDQKDTPGIDALADRETAYIRPFSTLLS